VRDRAVTLLGAILVLAVVYGLVFDRSAEPEVTRPQSEEAPNGYLALRVWLERQGVAVTSVQTRFTDALIDSGPLPPRGNVLLTTIPQQFRIRADEGDLLDQWIERGNTLLVMASIDDSAEWSLVGGVEMNSLDEVYRRTGLAFELASLDSEEEDDEEWGGVFVEAGEDLELHAIPGHPLTAGVRTLLTTSAYPSAVWTPAQQERLLISLGTVATAEASAIWQMSRGEGQILLVPSASLLTNRSIGRADNRMLVANLLRHHLAADGVVLFDDMHQGLSVLYDAQALFEDPRFRKTVWFVVGCWLIWVLGATARLAPPPSPPDGPRQLDWLEAVGGLLHRKLSRADAGRLMVQRWFNDVRRARGVGESDHPDWAELRAVPALDQRRVDELERTYSALQAGAGVDLVGLHNDLRELKRMIG